MSETRGLADFLAWLRDEDPVTITTTAGALRAAIQKSAPDRLITPQEAAVEFGYGVRWWQHRASEIDGAHRDSPKGRWRFRREAAAAYVDRIQHAEAREMGLKSASKAQPSWKLPEPVPFIVQQMAQRKPKRRDD